MLKPRGVFEGGQTTLKLLILLLLLFGSLMLSETTASTGTMS